MPRGRAGSGNPRPIFRGLNVAISGTFEDQWTEANISRWVTLRKGTFSPRMSDEVTHFVCTKEEFDKRGPKVKEALRRAHKREKRCHLVSLDWFKDSLFADRRLTEDAFSHVASLKALQAKVRLDKKIAKGKEEEKRSVNENYYHVYFDPTDCFEYHIMLTRDDEEMGIEGEIYVVKLYESNALPHLYHVGVRFYRSKRDNFPKLHRLTDAPGDFWQEHNAFKRFFEIKVGYPWDERLIRGVGSLGTKFFSYQPPTRGKPVGWVPERYIPKEPTPPPAEVNTIDTRFASLLNDRNVLVSPSNSEAQVNINSSESMPNDGHLTLALRPKTEVNTNPEATSNDQPVPISISEAAVNTNSESIPDSQLALALRPKVPHGDQMLGNDQHPTHHLAKGQVIMSLDTPIIDTEETWHMMTAAEATLPTSTETSVANT